MTLLPELAGCPFCGRRQTEMRDGNRNAVPGVYIWCSSCGAQGRLFTFDPIITSGKATAKEQAIAAWNTRAAEAPLRAQLERATALLKRCRDREYNPFEPDNQSQLFSDIRSVLAELEGEK